MKLVKRISLFIVLCVFFTLGFLIGARYQTVFYPGSAVYELPQNAEMVQAVYEPQQTLSADTVYHIVEMDEAGAILAEYFEHVPQQYMGMNLQQFNSALDEYNASPGLLELQKGFLYMEVRRFSAVEVLINKTYSKKDSYKEKVIIQGYYLGILQDHVAVYKEDGETLYMTTDIPTDKLPQIVKQELLQKRFVQDEEELYDFLESYSS